MSGMEGREDDRRAAADDAKEDLELSDETADEVRGGVMGWPKKYAGGGGDPPPPPPTQK